MGAIVTTRSGKLEGEEANGLLVFKGIPFATPPVGARRWLPPERPAMWHGVREARRFGSVAPQRQVLLGMLSAMRIDEPQSEDCLYLNVWTPKTDGGRRPVMVWIHGGGFSIGSGSQGIYDGSVLARRGDVVVVTINYRLGALGFMRLADVTGGKIPATGNEGLLDQITALEWVRDNIAEFGGNPGNVTIFGESAGGMSVGTLLAMETARGLFHKAIPQSGACHTGASVERANRTAERVLTKLGVSIGDAAAIRALTPDQLLKGALSSDGVTPDPELGMAYQPVTDGTTLARSAIEVVAQGSASGVAVMAGSALEEWKLFAVMDPLLANLDKKGLGIRIGRRVTPAIADSMIGIYEEARGKRGAPTTPSEVFSAIETDRVFRMPAVRLAEQQKEHQARVYSYLFTWQSPAMNGALGSCHALELGFVFGTNHLPGMGPFAGSGPAADKLAREMQDAWLAFARSGDPSCDSVGHWPAYDSERRATMVFDQSSKAENAPFDDERRAWEAVPDKMLGSL